MSSRVIVIGAGVGTLIAAELAKRGVDVTLVDEHARPLGGASGRHGRRLHLGEHYSGDPAAGTRRLTTGQTCMLGALSLVERWPQVASGPRRWWQFIVDGSMTTPDDYHDYLAGLRRFHAGLRARGLAPDSAFGAPADRHRTLLAAEYAALVDAGRVATAVESREPVIDAPALYGALMRTLNETDVELLMDSRVVALNGSEGAFALTVRTPTGQRELHATHVVNAAWHGLAQLTDGLTGRSPAVTARMRVMAEVRLSSALAAAPSMYFHRGVFGNHTTLSNGRALLLAEDVCNLATDAGPAPPPAWRALLASESDETWLGLFAQLADHPPERRAPAAGRLSARVGTATATELREDLAAQLLASYRRWVPSMPADVVRLIPNVVVSAGDAELDDPTSAVHRRDAIVREPVAGYVEVLTGKLTYLVLVAEEAVARVLAHVRGMTLDDMRRSTMTPIVHAAWTEEGTDVD